MLKKWSDEEKQLLEDNYRNKMARNIILKLRSIKELDEIRFKRKWDKILIWEESQKAHM